MQKTIVSADEFGLNQEESSRVPILPPEFQAEFVSIGLERLIPKNEVVVREGEPAEAFYLILEGQVRVFISDQNGREAELNVLGPGEYFGELMFGSNTRTATVKAIGPVRLVMLRRAECEHLLSRRPDMALHIIQTLIHRVRLLTRAVHDLALVNVYGRVTQLFNELAREVDGKALVPAPISQQKIASRVGASRSMVNRILHDLTSGGYITVARNGIVLNRALPKRW